MFFYFNGPTIVGQADTVGNHSGYNPSEDYNPYEDAIPLDVYGSKSDALRNLRNRIFEEVRQTIPVSSPKRTKQVLKTVLINLWMGHFTGLPVRYARDKNRYSDHKRYGRIFLKYDRVIPAIDALEVLGYIEQKRGFYNREIKDGKQTRMRGTDKLLDLFLEYGLKTTGFFYAKEPEELIVLNDGSEQKKKVFYANTKSIRKQRSDLVAYNDFVRNNKITVLLDRATEIDFEFLINNVLRNVLTGKIELEYINVIDNNDTINLSDTVNPDNTTEYNENRHSKSITTNPEITLYSNNRHNYYYTTITQEKWRKAHAGLGFGEMDCYRNLFLDFLRLQSFRLSKIEDKECAKRFLSETFKLENLGVGRLDIRLIQEYLHRTYTRRSFEMGGRAYGPLHQNLPKHLRPLIRINGEPTVELDFSGYHIRMLYHRKGIDYAEDPYLVCEGPSMRAVYKVVGLVAINAKHKGNAYHAIMNKLVEKGLSVLDGPEGIRYSKELVNRFLKAHRPIADYLCSDVGIRLQNTDSHIMNAILMKLMDNGILGLSVFDSVIVAKEHEQSLYRIMMEEYEKVMGFKPVIG